MNNICEPEFLAVFHFRSTNFALNSLRRWQESQGKFLNPSGDQCDREHEEGYFGEFRAIVQGMGCCCSPDERPESGFWEGNLNERFVIFIL